MLAIGTISQHDLSHRLFSPGIKRRLANFVYFRIFLKYTSQIQNCTFCFFMLPSCFQAEEETWRSCQWSVPYMDCVRHPQGSCAVTRKRVLKHKTALRLCRVTWWTASSVSTTRTLNHATTTRSASTVAVSVS